MDLPPTKTLPGRDDEQPKPTPRRDGDAREAVAKILHPDDPDEARPHHAAGPSSWGAIDLCADYRRASRWTIPRRGVADDRRTGADRGTLLHRIAFSDDRESEGFDDLSSFDRRGIERWDEMRSELLDLYGFVESGRTHQSFIECRLEIHGPDGSPISYGYADEILLGPGDKKSIALVLDLKTHPTGYLPEHSTTLQGFGYALGVFQEFLDVETVVFAALAPYGPTRYTFALERHHAPAMAEVAARIVEKGERGGPRNAGFEQCQYCKRLGTCDAAEAVRREVVSFRQKGLPILRLDGLDGGGMGNSPGYEVVDQDALSDTWADLLLAEKEIQAAKSAVKEALMHGAEARDLHVPSRPGNRSPIEWVAFLAWMDETQGVPLEEVAAEVEAGLLTPTLKPAQVMSYLKSRENLAADALGETLSKKAAEKIVAPKMNAICDRAEDVHYVAWRRGKKPRVDGP